MTLILTTATAVIVIALASYVTTNLKAGAVTQNRSDRLSAADAGIRYAIDQLKLRNAGCILDAQKAVLPGVQADFNGAAASVTCERITNGFEGIQAFAAVLTGEGLGPNDSLLSSQSGSNSKVLGGPVYMSRINTSAFSLTPPVLIEDGPLLYHDTSGTTPCSSTAASMLPSNLVFEPELIFGPVCVSVPWTELFTSPGVPDLTALPVLDGSASAASAPGTGSYTDVSSGGGCRVFEPGRYIIPPDTRGTDSYFKTGDYVMDFAPEWEIRQSVVTAGRLNPLTTTANEISTSNACLAAQSSDPAPSTETGATFYFTQTARINVATQGSIEIHARLQGTADYVSFQTLCTSNADWCGASGDGGLGTASMLTAPAASSTGNFIFTDSGNNKEFVAHALVYAPLAQVEFGNVTNTATQRMKGGLIVSRLKLQSSASATNFEIAVPTSPITAEIKLTSTAVKDGETSVQAVVQYRPYESSIDERIRVNSWRVCTRSDCDQGAIPTSTCSGSDPVWSNSYYSNSNLAGLSDFVETSATVNEDWATGSPNPAIPIDGFSGKFERTVDLPGSGTYRFTVGSDDGQRLYIDAVLVLDDWATQDYSTGTNTVDIVITDPCSVDIRLEYFENTSQAQVSLDWAKL
ncbi:MAG: hypothetical protein ACJAR2_001221 [Ilumatobacter sp.]|jgi:hypothetical protein